MSEIQQHPRLLIDNRDQVCERIERVLREGFRIKLPDGREVQWHRRGVRFEEGNLLIEPLESGIFQRVEGSSGNVRWIHMFSREILPDFLNPLLYKMDRNAAESWYVLTLANVSLQRQAMVQAKGRELRRPAVNDSQTDEAEDDSDISAHRFG